MTPTQLLVCSFLPPCPSICCVGAVYSASACPWLFPSELKQNMFSVACEPFCCCIEWFDALQAWLRPLLLLFFLLLHRLYFSLIINCRLRPRSPSFSLCVCPYSSLPLILVCCRPCHQVRFCLLCVYPVCVCCSHVFAVRMLLCDMTLSFMANMQRRSL